MRVINKESLLTEHSRENKETKIGRDRDRWSERDRCTKRDRKTERQMTNRETQDRWRERRIKSRGEGNRPTNSQGWEYTDEQR